MLKTLRIRCLLALALVAFATWLATAHWFGREIPDPGVLQRNLQSRLLGEQRSYRVHLPDSYAREPHRRYPVVYVLDGSSQDVHTSASAELMARLGAMPETVVIGIPNTGSEGRNRDYTPPGMRQDADDAHSPAGLADRFLDFLQHELIPQVEREYRANGERVLAGNSRGGLFVIHSFIARPALFHAWIANSPALWRDDAAMVRRLDAFLRDHRDLRTTLFLSLGGAENAKMAGAYRQAVAVLQREAPPGLRWRSSITPDATHADNAQKATPLALQWTAPVHNGAEASPLTSRHELSRPCVAGPAFRRGDPRRDPR